MNRKFSKLLILTLIVFIFSLTFATKALSQTSTLHFTFGNGGNPDGNFKFYCQSDSRWGNKRYDTGSYTSSGCGPSSMAMILATFGLKAQASDNQIATPVTVGDLFVKEGFTWFPGNRRCYNSSTRTLVDCAGTSPYKITDSGFLSSIGLKRTQADIINNERALIHADITEIKNYTDSGWYILGSVRKWPLCSGCNHTFVVVDANPAKDTITVASPSDNCGSNYKTAISLSRFSGFGSTFMSLVPIKLK